MYYLTQPYPKNLQRKSDNDTQLTGEETSARASEVIPKITQLVRGRAGRQGWANE